MNQNVRILGGLWRGKKLMFPGHSAIRPTPSRVRETLFNWLMHDINNTHCLDAFSGSGALGFEALSRGAKSVDFIDSSPQIAHYLKTTLASFPTSFSRVMCKDTLSFLSIVTLPYDIIFLDAPFLKDYLIPSINIIEQNNNCLKINGLLYVESSTPPELDPLFWEPLKNKKAGHVFFALFKKIS